MKTKNIEKQSLLNDAFETLLNGLGPQKTTALWNILLPSQTNYSDIRQKIFKGKNTASIYEQAKKFNKGAQK